MQAQRGGRGIALSLLDFDATRGWAVNATPRPLYPLGKIPPLYRWLVVPRDWSGQVRKISPPPGYEPRTVQSVGSHYTDYAVPAHVKVKSTKPAEIMYIFCFAERQSESKRVRPFITQHSGFDSRSKYGCTPTYAGKRFTKM
jgi:hypothetical protein